MSQESSLVSLSQLLEAQRELSKEITERMSAVEAAEQSAEASEIVGLQQEAYEFVNQLIATKSDDLAFVLKDVLPSDIALMKERAKLYAEAAKSLEGSLARLKGYVQYCLESSGKTKLTGKETTLALRNGRGAVDVGELNPADFANTEFVQTRIEYVWCKQSILDFAKTHGEEALPQGISIKRSKSIVVQANKK